MVTVEGHEKLCRLVNACRQGADNTTPMSLVQEMIDKIPEEVWKDTSATILDPAAGTGSFLVAAYWKMIEAGDTHENIICNRLFACEINLVYLKILSDKLGIKNIYNKDFLQLDLDMKFDVVIGNPPYQENTNTSGANKQGDFWYKFLLKATELTGLVAFVTPTSLFSSGGFGGKRHKVSTLLKKGFNFNFINPDVSNKFNVGIKICYFILENGNINKCTYLSDGDTITIDTDIPVPFILNSVNHCILRKTYNVGGGWPFKEVYKGSSDGFSVRFNGGRFKTYSKVEIGKTSLGVNKGQGIEIEESKVGIYASIFKSKLLKYVFIILGGESGQSATGILQSLPKPDINRVYSDEDLYEYFNLTQEEINLIESTVD